MSHCPSNYALIVSEVAVNITTVKMLKKMVSTEATTAVITVEAVVLGL